MTRLSSQATQARHPETVEGWDPTIYTAFTEVFAGYRELQTAVVDASRDLRVERFLDLGCGTGETAGRLLRLHHNSNAVVVDANRSMLRAAGSALPDGRVTALCRRLEDPLPPGPFDLVVSVLAVHHLEPAEKAALFARIHQVLAPGGRFVLGDLVLGEDGDAPTAERAPGPGPRLRRVLRERGWWGTVRLGLSRVVRRVGPRASAAVVHESDKPDRLRDQLDWLQAAGLCPEVRWAQDSLVVVAADHPGGMERHP